MGEKSKEKGKWRRKKDGKKRGNIKLLEKNRGRKTGKGKEMY